MKTHPSSLKEAASVTVLISAIALGATGCANTVEKAANLPSGTIIDKGSTLWDGTAPSKSNDDTYSKLGTLAGSFELPSGEIVTYVEKSSLDLICFPAADVPQNLLASAKVNPADVHTDDVCTYAVNLLDSNGNALFSNS